MWPDLQSEDELAKPTVLGGAIGASAITALEVIIPTIVKLNLVLCQTLFKHFACTSTY